MFTFIIILSLLVSLLLVLVVLMQNKGQGMTMNSGANQIFGASRSTDLIEKTTWVLAGTLVVLVILSAAFTGSTAPEAEQLTSPSIQRAKEQSAPAQGGSGVFDAPASPNGENQSAPAQEGQPATPDPLTE